MQNAEQVEQFQNPLIVQSDRTILLDVHAPRSEECRNALIPFAELERSPEHLHTYRLTPLSLWNAASAGISTEQIIQTLREFSRYQIPQNIEMWICETAERFGKLRLVQIEAKETREENSSRENSTGENSTEKNPPPAQEFLCLETANENIFKQIQNNSIAKKFLLPCERPNCFLLALTDRGIVKQKFLEFGWPIKDEAPLREGESLEINLREKTLSGNPLVIREYQTEAAESIVADRRPGTGFGTIALPCGSGKTIVGMKIMSMLKTSTLIITTNITAVHQWIDELLDKTNLTREQIAEYTGEKKDIAPVTIATYQILTWRPDKESTFPHFSIFHERAWGLIIYDEVHLLPAPVFRVVAELQAVRRVGLTATLVREDGCQGHVFSLVGPKRYDVPWKELEKNGFIASARCIELRVNLPEHLALEYAMASPREKHKIASTNPAKIQVAKDLVEKFSDDKILVIGQYLNQLKEIADLLKVPLITGKTPNAEREKIYEDFRSGKNRVIVVSKVANFAVDLPDASMAVELSGAFGSRQEEAQRLGRILRPKNLNKPDENFSGTSKFFTIITRRTSDEDFGSNRQKFLAEQGYSYKIILYNDLKDLDVLEEHALVQRT